MKPAKRKLWALTGGTHIGGEDTTAPTEVPGSGCAKDEGKR